MDMFLPAGKIGETGLARLVLHRDDAPDLQI